jgi:hypothetical protein
VKDSTPDIKTVWIFDPEGMGLERISSEKGNDLFGTFSSCSLSALCALPSAPRALPPFLMIPFRIVESNIKPKADLPLYVISK